MSESEEQIKSTPATPLPKVQIAIVVFVQVCEAMNSEFPELLLHDVSEKPNPLIFTFSHFFSSQCAVPFCRIHG